jgi:hypothetical protein
MPTDMAACTVSSARREAPAFSNDRRRRIGAGAGLTTTQQVADLPVFLSNIEKLPHIECPHGRGPVSAAELKAKIEGEINRIKILQL